MIKSCLIILPCIWAVLAIIQLCRKPDVVDLEVGQVWRSTWGDDDPFSENCTLAIVALQNDYVQYTFRSGGQDSCRVDTFRRVYKFVSEGIE